MKDVIIMDCPFCGLEIQVGGIKFEGELVDGVLHELPMCETFEELEPTEFIQAARMMLESVNNQ